MTNQNHSWEPSEHRINKLTRPLLRRIKKLQRPHSGECDCQAVLTAVMEKLDLIERLVEVIAVELERRRHPQP